MLMIRTNYILPSQLVAAELPEFTEIESALDHQFTPPVIALIADYADIPRKLETQKIIDIFLKGTDRHFPLLPKHELEESKENNPKQPAEPDAIRLKESDERKLIAYVRAYVEFLAHKELERAGPIDLNEKELIAGKYEKEYRDFIGKLKGIDILEKCGPENFYLRCHAYIFGHHEWFNPHHFYRNALFGPLPQVKKFLKSKDYQKLKAPIPGAVIQYCTSKEATHYGIIDSIDPHGNIIVCSKFGRHHVYKHKAENATEYYGRYALCYIHQKKSSFFVSLFSKIGSLWGRRSS